MLASPLVLCPHFFRTKGNHGQWPKRHNTCMIKCPKVWQELSTGFIISHKALLRCRLGTAPVQKGTHEDVYKLRFLQVRTSFTAICYIVIASKSPAHIQFLFKILAWEQGKLLALKANAVFPFITVHRLQGARVAFQQDPKPRATYKCFFCRQEGDLATYIFQKVHRTNLQCSHVIGEVKDTAWSHNAVWPAFPWRLHIASVSHNALSASILLCPKSSDHLKLMKWSRFESVDAAKPM